MIFFPLRKRILTELEVLKFEVRRLDYQVNCPPVFKGGDIVKDFIIRSIECKCTGHYHSVPIFRYIYHCSLINDVATISSELMFTEEDLILLKSTAK